MARWFSGILALSLSLLAFVALGGARGPRRHGAAEETLTREALGEIVDYVRSRDTRGITNVQEADTRSFHLEWSESRLRVTVRRSGRQYLASWDIEDPKHGFPGQTRAELRSVLGDLLTEIRKR